MVRTVLAGAVIAALAACGSTSDSRNPAQMSNEALYAQAKNEIASSTWIDALRTLERLQARDPFSVFAQQAMLETAYVHWRDSNPTEALATLDRFQRQFPNHPATDYALYLRGLVNFNENLGFLARFTDQKLSERDPKSARESFDAFKELATRFPDSVYTPDAIDRMNFLVNALAEYEVHVARYYLRRGAPLAAINRAQFAVKTYQTAPALEEALAIMVIAYDELKQPELAKDAQRVLDKNFPNSGKVAAVRKVEQPRWWSPF
ncbi:outer membrane protein assembly factor BamD [Piscinibacterium candidicorallinum]|uniref:Outer membrane protein assembly factor BamD n=1 Tax=Piscinibacterium candidicorallinum TaxID=1793872 RepID=A0ABV7GZQ0_9BURK